MISTINLIVYIIFIWTLFVSIGLICHFKFHLNPILTLIITFYGLFWGSMSCWEIIVTPIFNEYATITENNLKSLGYYGAEGICILLFAMLSYLIYLKKRPFLEFIFIFLFLEGYQLLTGILGDFGYFLIRGLNEFNPIDAYWIAWKGNFPISYLKQFFYAIYFIFFSYLCKFGIKYKRLHSKSI